MWFITCNANSQWKIGKKRKLSLTKTQPTSWILMLIWTLQITIKSKPITYEFRMDKLLKISRVGRDLMTSILNFQAYQVTWVLIAETMLKCKLTKKWQGSILKQKRKALTTWVHHKLLTVTWSLPFNTLWNSKTLNSKNRTNLKYLNFNKTKVQEKFQLWTSTSWLSSKKSWICRKSSLKSTLKIATQLVMRMNPQGSTLRHLKISTSHSKKYP